MPCICNNTGCITTPQWKNYFNKHPEKRGVEPNDLLIELYNDGETELARISTKKPCPICNPPLPYQIVLKAIAVLASTPPGHNYYDKRLATAMTFVYALGCDRAPYGKHWMPTIVQQSRIILAANGICPRCLEKTLIRENINTAPPGEPPEYEEYASCPHCLWSEYPF